MDKLSDEELIIRYRRRGDLRIVGILFDRYAHLVYGVCLKYLKNREASQDAVMEIFEKIVVELKHRDVRVFRSWLYVLARNHCLMQLRSQKIHEDIDRISENTDYLFMESYPEMHPLDEDLQNKKLKDCLENLSSEQKHCVELFYYKEKSYQQISDITNFEIRQVKSYIQNGKRNLKNCMEK